MKCAFIWPSYESPFISLYNRFFLWFASFFSFLFLFLLVPTNKHVACVFVFFSLFIYLTHCHPIATHLITVQRAHLYYKFRLSLLLSVCCGNRTLHLLTIVTILSLSLSGFLALLLTPYFLPPDFTSQR